MIYHGNPQPIGRGRIAELSLKVLDGNSFFAIALPLPPSLEAWFCGTNIFCLHDMSSHARPTL